MNLMRQTKHFFFAQAHACGLAILFLVAFPSSAFAAGGGDPKTMLLFSTINFSLFVALIVWVYKKFGAKELRARSARISDHLAKSRTALAEAEREYEVLKARLSDLDQVKKDLFARYDQEGRKQSSLILENANSSSSRMSTDAERMVDTELSQASKKLRGEVVGLAVEKTRGKLSSISETDDKRLRAEALKIFLSEATEVVEVRT